jgi:hypothetical protein
MVLTVIAYLEDVQLPLQCYPAVGWTVDVSGLGLTISITLYALFYLLSTDGSIPRMYILVYVDYLMIISLTMTVNNFSACLECYFKVVGPPPADLFQYLGMMVTHNHTSRSIAIEQTGYIRKIMERFNMITSSSITTPLDPSLKAIPIAKDESPADISLYQQAIRSLLYAAMTSHPDISYAIGVPG